MEPSTKCFPGATGHGTDTTAGNNGQVVRVRNLKDSGPGSLREALLLAYPRRLTFDVGGTIRLKSPIEVKTPYLTVDGQDAPPPGITVRDSSIVIGTHDVLLRHLRLRPGDEGPARPNRDCVTPFASAAGKVYNIVVDSCSLTWATDECVGTAGYMTDLTFSNCLIAQGLLDSIHTEGPHSMGFLLGSRSHRVSIHRNVIAASNSRLPKLPYDTDAEVVNNVIFNWGSQGTGVAPGDVYDTTEVLANIVRNYYLPGPDTRQDSSGSHGLGITVYPDVGPNIHIRGNIGPGRPDDTYDEWAGVFLANGALREEVETLYARATPSDIAVEEDMNLVYNGVLDGAGATLPARDARDSRAIAGVRDGTLRIVNVPAW